MNYDIGQAVVQLIEDQVAAPLRDGGTDLKVYADNAPGLTPPYVVLIEPGEDEQFQSQGEGDAEPSSITMGDIQVSVFADDRGQAATIGKLVRDTLKDAEMIFDFGTLLEFRPNRQFFSPEPEAGLGEPSIFHRVLMFHYAIQRS